MSISQYVQGDLIDCPMSFTDVNGVLIDPSTVEFNFTCGGYGPIKWTYAGSSTATTGTVWRVSQGIFRARVDSTPFYGLFQGAGIAKGTGQSAALISFMVIQNPLLP